MTQDTAHTPLAEDPLAFYKSLTSDRRELESDLLALALENHVYPETLRYAEFRDVVRGVVKSVSGELHYFQLPPNGIFHIVKADDPERQWEAARILKSATFGCDLIRAKQDDDEEDEEDGKAGANISAMMPPSVPEEQNVASQTAQITEVHPGGAMGTTPQQDDSAARWHGQSDISRALPQIDHAVNPHAWNTTQLLKAWGEQLQATAPSASSVDPQMKRFMVEVMGKTPYEVDSGQVRLNGMQRAQYNQWLTKSLRGRLSGLEKSLTKSRGNGTP